MEAELTGAADDPKTVYVSGFDDTDFTNRTWRSTDGGNTVQEISSLLPACAVGGVPETARGAVYLQTFDLDDLDHLELITAEVMPAVAG